MGAAVHQVASASLTALFSIGMLIAAHFFMQHQSVKAPSVMSSSTLVSPI